jgi:hypothetical protein
MNMRQEIVRVLLVWGLASAVGIGMFINAPSAFARDYYVANAGNDANNGTAPETAWKTLARINAEYFTPGDKALLKRGDVWRESLYPRSGDESGCVAYGAYGEGNKPLILGSVSKSSPEDWREERDHVWVAGAPVETGRELLKNPSFSDDISDWSLYVENSARMNGARIDSESDSAPGCYRVESDGKGGRESDAQFSTIGLPIERGKAYRMRFRVRASEPIDLRLPTLMKAGPPWSSYSQGTTPPEMNVTTEWTTGEAYYSANTTDENARLTFFMGDKLEKGVSLFFDTLSFVECDSRGFLSCDVGNIIFDDGAAFGVKVWNESDLTAPNLYWYDETNHLVKVYSETNPALAHRNVECALRRHLVDESNVSYIVIEGLAFKYGAAHGVGGANTHHIMIRDCDFSYIGGGDQSGGDKTVRFGNGVEFWAGAHDNIVEKCRFWEIYDAALTNQSMGSPVKQCDIIYRDNVIWNSEYSFEYWNRPEESITSNITFEHNTCINAGSGWGHAQRPDPSGRHLCFYDSSAGASGIRVRNNIFIGAAGNAFYAPGWKKEQIDALDLDENCWLQETGEMMNVAGKKYSMAQFAEYQRDFAKEARSILGPLQFADADKHDYHLVGSEPSIQLGSR